MTNLHVSFKNVPLQKWVMHPTVQIAVVKEQERNDRYRLMCQQKGKSKCLI